MLELSEVAKSDIATIKKANCLIQVNRYIGKEAGKSLSLLQCKIITYCLSLLDADAKTELEKDNIHERLTVRFTIPEFWTACGICARGKKYYTMVGEALQDMRDRSAWMLKTNDKTGRKEAVTVSWVLKAKVLDDKTTCEVTFDPDLAPVLLNLKDNYTQYPLDAVMYLKSKYGFYLFDLICSYESLSNEIRIDLQKFTELIDGTQYTSPSRILQKIIAPAIEDINSCKTNNMQVNAEMQKTGTKITHIVLRCLRNSEKALTEASDSKALSSIEKTEDMRQIIKEQIGYDSIYADIMANTLQGNMQTVDLIVETIFEILSTPKNNYLIHGVHITGIKVQEKFKTITEREVRYALESIGSVVTPIRHPKSYLRSTLYSATETVSVYEVSKQIASQNNKKKVPTGATGELGQAELEAIFKIMEEPIKEGEDNGKVEAAGT